MMSELNIPDSDHLTALRNERDREMIETWSEIAVDLDARTVIVYGENAGRSVNEVLQTIAYAHVAKAAFSLGSAAAAGQATFDPAVFGSRCTMIAREQILRSESARGDLSADSL